MSRYAKAIAAAVTTLILYVVFGDDPKTNGADINEVETAIATLVTTFAVWAIRNSPEGS